MIGKIFKWIGLGVIGIFVLLVVIGSLVPDKKKSVLDMEPTSAGVPSVEQPAKPVVPVINVDARQLYADYSANEVAADQKYKGKNLVVTGTIKSIDKGFMDRAYLNILSGNEFSGVQAHFGDEHHNALAQLSKGKKVTVSCQGNGRMMDSPMLKDCSLQ